MKIFENLSAKGKVLSWEDFKLFRDVGAGANLDGLDKATKEYLLKMAEEAMEDTIPPLPASLYRQYHDIGTREMYEAACFARRGCLYCLAFGEAVEKKGRFMPAITDYIWAILEETTWVIPAHKSMHGPLSSDYKYDCRDLDLFAAGTGGLLSLCLHLLGERLNEGFDIPIITDRIKYEVHRRVLLLAATKEYNWMAPYANNWNPWIFSNVLFCLTACESDLKFREDLVQKSMARLDNFIMGYGEDGGCDEGPTYWGVAGASCFDCLELLFDLSGGAIDLFSHPLVRAMGEYIMKMHIHDKYFVAFADSPHKIGLGARLVNRFGWRTGNEKLQQFGASFFPPYGAPVPLTVEPRVLHSWRTCYRSYKDLAFLAANGEELSKKSGKSDFEYDLCHYLSDIQVAAMRESKISDKGFFAAIKGGHNAESHNHNDIGSFVVYFNGEPLFADAGVDTYSKTTFSDRRYTLWYMQSSFHNLPDIGGATQKDGEEYKASDVKFDGDKKEFSLELKSAYPSDAGITSFRRTLCLEGGGVRVVDRFVFDKSAKVSQNYMFSEQPDLNQRGKMLFSNGVCAYYDESLEAKCEAVSLLTEQDLAPGQNPRGQMAQNWEQDYLYRVTLSGVVEVSGEYELVIKAPK